MRHAVWTVMVRAFTALMILPASGCEQSVKPPWPDMSAGYPRFSAKNALTRLSAQMLWNFLCHVARVLRGYGKYNIPLTVCWKL